MEADVDATLQYRRELKEKYFELASAALPQTRRTVSAKRLTNSMEPTESDTLFFKNEKFRPRIEDGDPPKVLPRKFM